MKVRKSNVKCAEELVITMFVRWFCLYGGIKGKCFGTSKTSCKVLIVSTETTYEKGHESMEKVKCNSKTNQYISPI